MRKQGKVAGGLVVAAGLLLSGPAEAQDCQGNAVFGIHNEKVTTTKEQAGDYTPAVRDYYVRQFNDRQNIYLKAALSKAERQAWLGGMNSPEFAKCMNVVLDELAVIARKTLPTYRGSGFAVRNAAEEQLLKGAVQNLAAASVIRAGLGSANWNIEKNGVGIPTLRYKYGMVYARQPNADDGFCRIHYVNVIQDYSGGGTYNASRALYITTEFAGCP